MSDKNMARRARVEITFDGVDITASMLPYLLSVSYTDNQEDTADALQLNFQDTSAIWLTDWLNQAVDAAAGRGMAIQGVIVRQNWNSDGKDDLLDTGTFELESVTCSGPPSTVAIKGTSLPFTSQIRQTKKTKAWEKYDLAGIANEMAGANGMVCMFLSAQNPFYDRVEQYDSSDIELLSQLCHDAGCSLKATDKMIVIFDQSDYESKGAVKKVKRGDHSYTKWRLGTTTADTQYTSCRVSYNDPATGKSIEGIAYCEDYDSSKKSNQQLEVSQKVGSIGEAKELAAKLLRLHNKFERTVQFTFPGDPALLAGLNIELEDWGGWDGKYIITQAKHTVNASGGYTTTVNARRVLEGY